MEIKVWEPSKNKEYSKKPKGILFIIHGMGEYHGRYEEVGEYISDNGYKVMMINHQGHGENLKEYNGKKELGYIDDDFEESLNQLEKIIKQIKKENQNLPLYILGHSMGSFMTQVLLGRGIENDGIILSGSNRPNKLSVLMGYGLTKGLSKLRNKRDKFIETLIFGLHNIKFKDSNHDFRWLSRDINKVEEYEKDRMCGTSPYTSYFRGLFKILLESIEEEGKKDKVETPLYIFSGDEDPVGEYGKGTKNLYKFYKELGYKDLELKLYPKGRHEMLNEVNREKVYKDVIDWLDRRSK